MTDKGRIRSRIRIRNFWELILESGSVQKYHGSGTLVPTGSYIPVPGDGPRYDQYFIHIVRVVIHSSVTVSLVLVRPNEFCSISYLYLCTTVLFQYLIVGGIAPLHSRAAHTASAEACLGNDSTAPG
jgi:hypothetical protein